jgi:hypothetical protein
MYPFAAQSTPAFLPLPKGVREAGLVIAQKISSAQEHALLTSFQHQRGTMDERFA